MRVLITGGAGFIGSHVGRSLQERGDEVVVLDNFNDYYDPKLKRARLAYVLKPETPVLEVDIVNAEQVEQAVSEVAPDSVLHLAAWAGVRPSRAYPSIFAAANIQGTVNVFEACKRTGVTRLIFASSSSVYGPNAPVPSKESSAGDDQRSSYGVSKRAGELYAALYHRSDGLRVTCLRFFTVYGPWGRPDMAVWKFTDQILRDQPLTLYVRSDDGREVRRGFTEIRDVVSGTLAALDRDLPFAVLNLGSSDQVPLRRLVSALETALGKRANVEERILPSEEEIQTGADLTEAKALLEYAPTVQVEAGAQHFADWYLSKFLEHFPHGLAPSRFWD